MRPLYRSPLAAGLLAIAPALLTTSIAVTNAQIPPTEPATPDPSQNPAPTPAPQEAPAIPSPPDVQPLPPGDTIITGEVSDAVTLDPLAGVIITIRNTNRSAESNPQGRFQIDGLPAGTHEIEIFKLGYSNETTQVTTVPGQPVDVRLSLRAKPTGEGEDEFTLEEETVIGEYEENSSGDLFLNLDAGANMVSGIDKEQFSRMAVSDAAGAVSKIAGANIVGGRYAVVRGLGDRYSNTLVNGALVSSADPSRKAVQLDLFPSDLLQSVGINKTATANLPAEFAGGMILLQTLRLPEQRIIELELKTETNSNFGDNFYRAPEKSISFWGNLDASIPLGNLPDGFLNPGHEGNRPPEPPEERAAANQGRREMEKLHASNGMRPKKDQPENEIAWGLTLGDTYTFANEWRLGGVLSFTHDNGSQVRENMEVGRGVDFGTDLKPGGDGSPETNDFAIRSQTEDRYTEYNNWGALANVGLEAGDNHRLGLTWFQNRSSETTVVLGRRLQEVGGEFPTYLAAANNPFGAGAYTYLAFDQILPLSRDLEILQLDGQHTLGTENYSFQLDWMASRSTAIEDRPHTRSLFFSELDFADERIKTERNDVYKPGLGTVYTAADVHNSSPPLVKSFRESLSTTEDAGNERIDLTFPIWDRGESNQLDLKLGANRFERQRQVRGRFFEYTFSPALNNLLLDFEGQEGVDYLNDFDSLETISGDPKFNGWTGPQADVQNTSLILTESTLVGRTVRNVDAGNEIDALYLMADLAWNEWGANAGFRHEAESRYYQVLPGLNAVAFVNEEPVYQDNDYLLPSVSLWRTFGHKDQFKATLAWSQTVARPTFFEYAPVEIEDQASGDVIVGNPDLRDTEITNFDLELSWDPSTDSRLVLGLFRKDMQSPIAQAFDSFRRTWVNGDSGELQGIELTASHQLGAGWDVAGNYTFIDSLLTYQQKLNTLGETQTINSSFEGQPSHIFNFVLGYEYEPWETRASLVYNLTGSYLTGVPATSDSVAVMREAFHSLDLVISRPFRFQDCDGSVRLKIVNLLDSEDRQVFEGTDVVFQSFSPGRAISLGAELKF